MPYIKMRQIHPELRFVGILARCLFPYYTATTFRAVNKVQDFLMKGRWFGRCAVCSFAETLRPDGTSLRLLICVPLERKSGVPGVLWLHGGGYAVGLPEQDVFYIEHFIHASSCIVVAPDYTLSTKKPYPAALEDCYLALRWMKENAARLGIRDDQLFVCGDSAGGGLTAALTLYARDKGDIAIAFQMPLYPMLDDRMKTTSAQANDAPVWNTKSSIAAWKLYLGERYGTEDVPCYAVPARAVNYAELPPTCTFVGSIDAFCDETSEYVDNLRKADVPVDFKIFEGGFHAFDYMVPRSSIAKAANQFYMDAFRHAVQNCFAVQPGQDA